MTLEVRVFGATQLEALAKRIRYEGDQGLMKELRRALSKADKPLEADVKAGMPTYLPDRYAAVLAKATKFKNNVRTVGRQVSVTMVVTAKGVRHDRQIKTIDNPGLLRHPVFARGRRSSWTWAKQRVRPGVVSDKFDEHKDRIRRDIMQAMDNVADKITKG